MGGLTQGIPAERLLAGERFSIEYAPVEREGSRKVGDIRFSTPVSMRNEFTTIRIHDKVGGAMLNKKIAFGIPVFDEKTKIIEDRQKELEKAIVNLHDALKELED